jgi:hypothetical protein
MCTAGAQWLCIGPVDGLTAGALEILSDNFAEALDGLLPW